MFSIVTCLFLTSLHSTSLWLSRGKELMDLLSDLQIWEWNPKKPIRVDPTSKADQSVHKSMFFGLEMGARFGIRIWQGRRPCHPNCS